MKKSFIFVFVAFLFCVNINAQTNPNGMWSILELSEEEMWFEGAKGSFTSYTFTEYDLDNKDKWDTTFEICSSSRDIHIEFDRSKTIVTYKKNDEIYTDVNLEICDSKGNILENYKVSCKTYSGSYGNFYYSGLVLKSYQDKIIRTLKVGGYVRFDFGTFVFVVNPFTISCAKELREKCINTNQTHYLRDCFQYKGVIKFPSKK